MTFWAKLLIVVLFILSLIFASMSVVLFGKREPLRELLEAKTKQYDQEKADWTRRNEDLNAKVTAAATAVAQANSNAEAKQLLLDTATNEVERLNADMRAKDIENQKDKNLNLEQAAALSSIGTQVKALLASEDRLKTESNTLSAKLIDEQSRSNKLEKENGDLNASLKTATASLSKAEETLKLNDDIFAELSRRNVAWREMITSWTTLPDIKAKVLRVDTQSNFILLNAGAKQGVKKNYTFSIFREGVFVAKVMVFDVQDDLCAARVVVPKLPIQRGDNAWTRLSD
jgi:predicted  nucleic acid-binding Zn-ribbon protein